MVTSSALVNAKVLEYEVRVVHNEAAEEQRTWMERGVGNVVGQQELPQNMYMTAQHCCRQHNCRLLCTVPCRTAQLQGIAVRMPNTTTAHGWGACREVYAR